MCLLSKIALARDNNIEKSKLILQKAFELSPDDENVLFELGMLMVTESRFTEAKHHFDRVLDNPNGKISRAYVGKVYLHY